MFGLTLLVVILGAPGLLGGDAGVLGVMVQRFIFIYQQGQFSLCLANS